jgi:hypothetical protein
MLVELFGAWVAVEEGSTSGTARCSEVQRFVDIARVVGAYK